MLSYLYHLWLAIIMALTLRPAVAQAVERYPESGRIVLGVVFLAGVSMLFGQSVVLFLNRVRPQRFVLSLIANGVVFIVSGAVWALAIYFGGRWLFAETPSFGLVVRLVGLSFAPQVFGFLILIPYAGPFIQRVLYTWSLLIATRAVQFSFGVGFFPALFCVALGWLLLWLLTVSIGRPVVALRNRIVNAITGTRLDASTQEILAALASKGKQK